MVKTIKRSVPFTLCFSNTGKLDVVDTTAKEYRRVINYFLGRLQKGEELTEEFLKRFSTPSPTVTNNAPRGRPYPYSTPGREGGRKGSTRSRG